MAISKRWNLLSPNNYQPRVHGNVKNSALF